jgi:hypothetical protein
MNNVSKKSETFEYLSSRPGPFRKAFLVPFEATSSPTDGMTGTSESSPCKFLERMFIWRENDDSLSLK